jgi:hypothetical protein
MPHSEYSEYLSIACHSRRSLYSLRKTSKPIPGQRIVSHLNQKRILLSLRCALLAASPDTYRLLSQLAMNASTLVNSIRHIRHCRHSVLISLLVRSRPTRSVTRSLHRNQTRGQTKEFMMHYKQQVCLLSRGLWPPNQSLPEGVPSGQADG